MQAYLQSSLAARNPLHGKDCSTASARQKELQPEPDRVSDTGMSQASDVLAKPHQSRTIGKTLSVAEGAGIAHDNGNLLAALGLYCDLLGRPGVLRPEHQHYVTELRLLAERSGQLMRSLLMHLPTGETSTVSAEAAPQIGADPAAKLREIAPLLVAIASPSATVAVRAPRTLPPLTFPTENLERIIVNLIRNAAQAIEFANSSDRSFEDRQPGRIRVALATIAGHLHLTVEDNGPGMPVATAAAFLSPSTLPQGSQRGLGHHIVHQLVTSSGGTLSVRVRPGRGTTFCIKWPVPEATRPAGQRPSARRSIGVAA